MKSLRIALVEDDVDLCDGWRDILELSGHVTHCFIRARDAIDAFPRLGEVDVLVTDFYLPDLNGLELVRAVREKRPELPTILLTGSREASIVEAARKLPNAVTVFKPLGADELEAAIVRLLGARS